MKLTPFALAALAALAACSSVPDRNLALDQARARHASVRSDAAVSTHAADELRRADVALRAAESAHASGADRAEVDHLAYLTGQRVTIAQETATGRSAQAVTAGAAAERDRLRLALRTAEADAAKRDLAAAELTGARTGADLADAERAAAADRARLASSTAQVASLQQQLQALNARQTDRGLVVTLGDVLFDSGQSRLQADGGRSMLQLAEFMRRYPQRQASIEGYTDDVGSESSNLDLSDRRARSVMAALVGMGVGADRLRPRGFGEANPVGANDSAAGRQMNRRVEVIFTPEAGGIPPR